MNILDKKSPTTNHPTATNNTNNSNTTNNSSNNNNNSGSSGTNGGNGGPNGPPPGPCSSAGPPSTPLTPSSQDCMIPNSQLIPSLAAPPPSTVNGGGGPSSVSSSCSAPHTPLDSLNTSVNSQTDPLTSNTISRPTNVSTPSSVSFNQNNSAPNTPSMVPGCPPSVGSQNNDGNSITTGSPALNQLTSATSDFPVSQSPFANQNQTNCTNNSNSSTNLLSSPLSVHQQQQQSSICSNENVVNNQIKNKTISNGGAGAGGNMGGNQNKKHCNNRNNNQNNVANNNHLQNNNGNNFNVQQMNMNNSCAGPPNVAGSMAVGPNNTAIVPGDSKSQMNHFSMTPPHNIQNNQMPCMQNGLPTGMVNGSISPFDVDCQKIPQFPNEYSPNLPEGCPPPIPNSCPPPPRMSSNCHSVGGPINMPPMPPTSNMMNVGPNKNMCNMNPNMLPNAPPPPPSGHAPNIKTPPIDGGSGQFMQQHQNQVFVFSTQLANHAAEAVHQGHFPSIIHFHMNHPQTKKFIEKNSIKLQNFNRQPNNVWMTGNIRQPRIRGPNASNGMPPLRGNFNNPCFAPYNHNPPGPGPGGGGSGSPGPGQWNPNWPPSGPPNNHHHISGGGGGGGPFPPNDMKMNCGNTGPPIRPCGPSQQFNANNFNPQGYPMGCNDSTIQDGNLTPQQKQHRENKLAILANLQQKFLQHELMESNQNPNNNNNRLPPPPVNAQQSQPPSNPDHFVPSMVDPSIMTSTNSNQQSMMYPPHSDHSQMPIKQENDPHHMSHPHQPPPPGMNPSDMNFSSNFCPNPMMNSNHPNNNPNDPWLKSSGPNFPPIVEETKPFTTSSNGRRKGSQQNANHQSPISNQNSVNSPNQSCINQSPSNRVPPPPYNQGLHRSMSSPHPGSPAALSLPSPRMPATTSDTRQSSYTPSGSVRSGPSTPSADNGPSLINSPKSNSRTTSTNSSPGNSSSKKNKQQQQQQAASSIDPELNMFTTKSEHPLMPVPSPQQIDYINTFEGQELTIQKQPNAHFHETNELIGVSNNNNDLSGLNNDLFTNDFVGNMCGGSSAVNNNAPMQLNQGNNPRFPPINPQGPCNFDSRYQDNMRFNGGAGGGPMMDNYNRPPPHMCNNSGSQFNQNDPNSIRFPNCDMKPRMSGPSADLGPFPPTPNSMCDMSFANSIPPINDGNSFPNGGNSHPGFNDTTIDNPISSTHLQSLQKMAPPFDIAPNSKGPMGPNMMNQNQIMAPNTKGPRMQSNYDQPGPFGPGPMGNMPPCSDMNESNNYGAPPHMAQSNMPPMNYPNFSNSPNQIPSNMIPPGSDPQYGGMHSGGGSFSPMSMNASSHPMVDQSSSNGPSSMPMMPPGGPVVSQGNFPPRLSPNVNRPMNPSNTHGPRYNSPNIQVKPDAPNTIQYLPSRPQEPTTTPPNRPPNLDFLQQSLNMGCNKSAVPQLNTYYPSNSTGSMHPNRPNMNFGPRGSPMMRPPPQNLNSGTGPGTGSGNMCSGNDMMFNRPPAANHQMTNGPNRMPPAPNTNFGPNGPPLPPGNGPIAPPNSKPGNNGPVLHPDSFDKLENDSNYAAQFHNFQQQLYATNTRNSNNPRMTSNF